MRVFLRQNGVSIVWLGLFFLAAVCQIAAGHREYNQDQLEHGRAEIGLVEYMGSAHFLEALTENWESEFLQIFLYIALTAILFERNRRSSKNRRRSIGPRRPKSAWCIRILQPSRIPGAGRDHPDADRFPSDPASVDGRLDLPAPQWTPASLRTRPTPTQTVPLPPPLARSA